MFTAAFDLGIEWLLVKGIADFADGTDTKASWKRFACIMAASVVFHLLSDPNVFKDWPHYKAISAASFHFKTEWLIVKGIKNLDEEQSSDEKWTEFASVMAASVVAHSLRDSIIFQDWPHFKPDKVYGHPLVLERTCRNYNLVPFQCPKVKHDIALCKERNKTKWRAWRCARQPWKHTQKGNSKRWMRMKAQLMTFP